MLSSVKKIGGEIASGKGEDNNGEEIVGDGKLDDVENEENSI